MVKEFLCHKSANKFDINETGDYVDKYMNMSDTQYLMVYLITNTDKPKSSKSNDSQSSLNDDLSFNSFIKKYNVQPVFVAVFTVNELGGFLDLMATSPEYRRYVIATYMKYVIQAIVKVITKRMTLTLHCDTLVQGTYTNMGFAIHDHCNKNIIKYFGLSSDFKNNSEHMIFRKATLIDTTRYIYEMRTCFQYDDQQSLIY